MDTRLTPMHELLQYAEDRNIAIGAFEFWSFEVARAALAAAEDLSLPLILQCGTMEIARMGGLEGTVETLLRAAKGTKAPVALHLDHATSEDYCRAAVDAGFSSVMFDGSALPYAQNTASTRRICEYAHRAGVYTFEPHLNISRLRQIHALLPKVPLVLHGGSGTPMNQVQETIRNGIRKVNICTEIQIAMGRAYIEAQSIPGFKYNCDALWGAGEAAAKALIAAKIRAFALMEA